MLDPTAFDIDPHDGSFVVADAPNSHERLQIFIASGSRLGGFTLPGRELPRLTLDNLVLNGVGSLQNTGKSVLLNQPERGWLVTELGARRHANPHVRPSEANRSRNRARSAPRFQCRPAASRSDRRLLLRLPG